MTKLLTTITLGLLLVGTAWAGKPERERIKELEKLAREAAGAIKKECGCGAAIVGNWKTFPDVNKMFRCHDTVDAIKAATVKHCSDGASKKQFCKNVSRYEITFTEDRYAQPSYKGRAITTFCTDMKYTNTDELKAVLDKF